MTARTHHLGSTPETVHWGYYDAAVPPVLTVASGDMVMIETVSGGADNLPPGDSGFTVLDAHRTILARTPQGDGPHILTGPVYVEGALPGDVLRIDIVDVALRQDWGYNLTRSDKGALPGDFPQPRQIHIALDQKNKTARLPWGLDIPAAPFFGCMGVAPDASLGRVTSVVPGPFGGNIDNRDLGAGATLWLPVFVPGALFSAGDGHAAQGHGEVNLTAIETALTGTFRLSVEKGETLERPRAQTRTHAVTMAFDPDLDAAMAIALRDMIALIVRRTGLSPDDAYALCSIAADVTVTQVVNRSRGIHVSLPRNCLVAPRRSGG